MTSLALASSNLRRLPRLSGSRFGPSSRLRYSRGYIRNYDCSLISPLGEGGRRVRILGGNSRFRSLLSALGAGENDAPDPDHLGSKVFTGQCLILGFLSGSLRGLDRVVLR